MTVVHADMLPDLHHQPTLITTFPKCRAEAANVAILIQDRSLGREMDDLLGMSFLSRFDLSIGKREWKLSPKNRRTARAE
jgi:aspartyl protease family protein